MTRLLLAEPRLLLAPPSRAQQGDDRRILDVEAVKAEISGGQQEGVEEREDKGRERSESGWRGRRERSEGGWRERSERMEGESMDWGSVGRRE